MDTLAYIGLGGNLGDRRAYLERACALLAESDGVQFRRASNIYETDPVGPPGQDAYYNAVAEVATAMDPAALVARCKAVEGEIGRQHRERWGPREIDLDLLLCGAIVVESDTVHVPHPELHRRGFVLVPLAELNRDLLHPGLGRTVAELLDACPEPLGIRGTIGALAPAWIRATD